MSFITVNSASPLVLIVSVYSFCSGDSEVFFNNEAIPITPFIGVLISWLIVARNTLFALFACSASCLAFRSSAVELASCAVLNAYFFLKHLFLFLYD